MASIVQTVASATGNNQTVSLTGVTIGNVLLFVTADSNSDPASGTLTLTGCVDGGNVLLRTCGFDNSNDAPSLLIYWTIATSATPSVHYQSSGGKANVTVLECSGADASGATDGTNSYSYDLGGAPSGDVDSSPITTTTAGTVILSAAISNDDTAPDGGGGGTYYFNTITHSNASINTYDDAFGPTKNVWSGGIVALKAAVVRHAEMMMMDMM